MTEHDIQKNHRRGRIFRLLHDALVAQTEVDHRVRTSLREQVVAEVDNSVLDGFPHIENLFIFSDGCVGMDVSKYLAQQQDGFVAKSPATEQAAHIFLFLPQILLRGLHQRRIFGGQLVGKFLHGFALRESHNGDGRVLQSFHAENFSVGHTGGVRADEDHHHGFPAGFGCL